MTEPTQNQGDQGDVQDFNRPLVPLDIYGGGRYVEIGVGDLLDNRIGIQQLMNQYIETRHELERVRLQVRILEENEASASRQPMFLVFNSTLAFLSTIGIGFTTNVISLPNSTKVDWVIFSVCCIIFLATVVAPNVMSYRNRRNNAETR